MASPALVKRQAKGPEALFSTNRRSPAVQRPHRVDVLTAARTLKVAHPVQNTRRDVRCQHSSASHVVAAALATFRRNDAYPCARDAKEVDAMLLAARGRALGYMSAGTLRYQAGP